MALPGLSSSDNRLRRVSIPERGYADIGAELWTYLQNSEEFRRLHGEGIFEVAHLPSGGVRLKGTCYVGRAVCGDVLLEFREKIEGALAALLSYASRNAFRVVPNDTQSSDLGQLIILIVEQFLESVAFYVAGGRDFEYNTVKSVGSLVGGRLNITKSIQLRARGLGHLLAFEKNTVSFNIPVNKIILATLSEIENLARIIKLPDQLIAKSRGLSMIFADNRDHELLYRERSYFANLAMYISESYQKESTRDMMALASVILSRASFDTASERATRVPRTWFINLENLFETSVRKVLSSVVDASIKVFRGGEFHPAIFSLDQSTYRANPDLFIRMYDEPHAVGDVKYKAFDGWASSSDVYQLLVHAEAFGAAKAFLIFPGDDHVCRRIGSTRNGIETSFFSVRVDNLISDIRAVATQLGCNVSP